MQRIKKQTEQQMQGGSPLAQVGAQAPAIPQGDQGAPISPGVQAPKKAKAAPLKGKQKAKAKAKPKRKSKGGMRY